MITFEVTDHQGQRHGRIVDNGKVFVGRLALPVAPLSAADNFENLMRQVPPFVWAMAFGACALRLIWVVVRG